MSKLTNIYFIQSVIGGPIKIGHSTNVNRRLSQLQSGCPFRLNVIMLIENVEAKYEKVLHNKFSKFHVHGEWYSERIIRVMEKQAEKEHWLKEKEDTSEPVHPGIILEQNYIKPLNVKHEDLCNELDISRKTLYDIRMGNKKITKRTAIKLSKYFNTNEDMWTDLQRRYDVRLERRREKARR